MLISRLNRSMREDEAGQALVLGALVMLVLALSVFVTVQLANGINERMRVQDAADNAAFSTAAAVARSLNFISWVNRTTATQYVAAMALQGLVALFDGVQAWTGVLGDMMQDLAVGVCALKRIAQACCAACILPPVMAAACIAAEGLEILQQALEAGAKIAWKVSDGIGSAIDAIDPVIAKLVLGISMFNHWIMYGTQKLMRLMMAALLSVGPVAGNFQTAIMEETAGEVNKSNLGKGYLVAMGLLNGVNAYNNIFESEAEDIGKDKMTYPASPQELDKKQRAERLMAEITNSTRTGTKNMNVHWETNGGYSATDLLGEIAGSIIGFITGDGVKTASRLVMPMEDQHFTEEKASKVNSSVFSTAAASGQKCQNSQNAAAPKAQACQADQAACDAAKPACAACPPNPPNCSACQNQQAKCSKAATTCADAQTAQEKAEKDCDKANKDAAKLGNQKAVGSGNKANNIWHGAPNTSLMSRGAVLASASHVGGGISLAVIAGNLDPKVVGIQAAMGGSKGKQMHCRYDGRDKYPTGICPDYAITKATKCEEESQHEFYGMSRYVSFQVDENYPFGQTSYLALVNKESKEAAFKINGGKGALGFGENRKIKAESWAGRGSGWDAAQLSNTFEGGNPGDKGLIEGLNGWARSQCYYHRPDAWAEPPNLFNPYWKARLAPVGPAFQELSQQIGLGSLGPLGGVINEVLVH
ncbi:MAG: hypothetical protein QM765_19015 [Myxococcales bacterium]